MCHQGIGKPFSQIVMNFCTSTTGPTLLSQAEGFPVAETETKFTFHWWQAVGIAMFLWASWHHHKAHVILANLRKNEKGSVVTLSHRIPSGDWFDLVTCPHFFAEILIYISVAVTLGKCSFNYDAINI